jgi:hypothetical protein
MPFNNRLNLLQVGIAAGTSAAGPALCLVIASLIGDDGPTDPMRIPIAKLIVFAALPIGLPLYKVK